MKFARVGGVRPRPRFAPVVTVVGLGARPGALDRGRWIGAVEAGESAGCNL